MNTEIEIKNIIKRVIKDSNMTYGEIGKLFTPPCTANIPQKTRMQITGHLTTEAFDTYDHLIPGQGMNIILPNPQTVKTHLQPPKKTHPKPPKKPKT